MLTLTPVSRLGSVESSHTVSVSHHAVVLPRVTGARFTSAFAGGRLAVPAGCEGSYGCTSRVQNNQQVAPGRKSRPGRYLWSLR